MDYSIAVLAGDGIGSEIMREGLKVLEAISEKYNHNFNEKYAPFGAQAYLDYGKGFPEQTKTECINADAILKGPVGLDLEGMTKLKKKGVKLEIETVLALRKEFDTYANFRPMILPLSFADFSPLKKERLGDGINIMFVRELVGGNYFGRKVEGEDTQMKYAIDEGKYTKDQVERIARVAFEEAQNRQSKLTNAHKPNVMAQGRFWNAIVGEVAKSYKSVPLENIIIDNLAYQLVINPSQFNGVVLLENMQGDIITDEGAGILGSLGLMPSACLNPETGKGYFEPAHGSAPKIANQNIANPYAMIGSCAFMLENFKLEQEAQDIWDGLTKVFGDGYRTQELANDRDLKDKILTTSQFGDKVKENILAN